MRAIRDSISISTALLVGLVGLLCGMSWVAGYAFASLRQSQATLQVEVAAGLNEIHAEWGQTEAALRTLQQQSRDTRDSVASKASASDIRLLETQILDAVASLKKSLAATLTSRGDAASFRDVQATQYPELSDTFNIEELRYISTNLTSDDALIRERALQVVSLVGSVNERRRLIDTLTDGEEDVQLRRHIIDTMNWEGIGDEFAQLLQGGKHPEVFDALVSAAERNLVRLSHEDRVAVDDALTSVFSNSTDSETKLRVVDYFANTDPDAIEILAAPPYDVGLGSQVRERITFVRDFFTR